MDTDNELTEKVIGAIIEVSNTLGPGFLEKVYERALTIELQRGGISAISQAPVPVKYKGQNAGEYFADLLVEGSLVLELKCVDRLTNVHMAQCLNYLKASSLPLCLLANFHSSKAEWKRVIN